MSDKVAIKHTSYGKVEVIKVGGFMDMTQVAYFEEVLDRLIMQGNVQIVLDFSDLQYVSSAGLGAIIGRIRDVRKKNGDIKIGNCSPSVMEILTVFGFPEVFSVADSTASAIKMFGA